MSERIGNLILICAEKIAELRPYGPNGECICFDCGIKLEKTTERMMVKVLFGDEQQGENYV